MTGLQADWSATLKEFTNRNAGRRTVLEIDSIDIGAQEEEQDYPLKGVTFDPRDQRVQIMVGEEGSVERHLTHSIGNPEQIDVLRRADGRDEALRIVHGNGSQTLLVLR
jgi:hypothetical protein